MVPTREQVVNAIGFSSQEIYIGKDSDAGVMKLIQSIVSDDNSAKEPFLVLDIGVVVSHWETWQRHLPMCRPYYAVKCNPEPQLLAALAALGAGFDCASKVEIEAVLAHGVPARDIVYANTVKAEEYIKYAAKIGVSLTTFDSVEELHKLKSHHPNAAAILRIHPPVDSCARRPLGALKFGALPEEVKPLLGAARDIGIRVVGVSFHIGSGVTRTDAYREAISAAREVFDVAEKLGLPPMTILDVGGGFTLARLEETAAAIKAGVEEFFPGREDLTLMAEPGRYFAESPFTLVTTVIGKRMRGGGREYWINDGTYGALNCVIQDYAVLKPIPMACKSNKSNPTCEGSKTYSSTVFGPTCDVIDMIFKDYPLPELEVNDWLVFQKMGAYTTACSTSFNGFVTSAMKMYLVYSSPV